MKRKTSTQAEGGVLVSHASIYPERQQTPSSLSAQPCLRHAPPRCAIESCEIWSRFSLFPLSNSHVEACLFPFRGVDLGAAYRGFCRCSSQGEPLRACVWEWASKPAIIITTNDNRLWWSWRIMTMSTPSRVCTSPLKHTYVAPVKCTNKHVQAPSDPFKAMRFWLLEVSE